MSHPPKPGAFSLVEIVIALSITVIALISLIGLIGLGLQTHQDSRADSVAVFIADNVRAKLLADVNWPVPENQTMSSNNYAGPLNSFTNYYTSEGTELVAGQTNGFYAATLQFMPSPNLPYQSQRLDFIVLNISRNSGTNRIMSTFTLQRAHVLPRTWQ